MQTPTPQGRTMGMHGAIGGSLRGGDGNPSESAGIHGWIYSLELAIKTDYAVVSVCEWENDLQRNKEGPRVIHLPL